MPPDGRCPLKVEGTATPLHDGAQQRLVSLSLSLRLARSRLEPSADPGQRFRIDQVEAELRVALVELRELAHGIFPAVLADEGLAAAVEALAEEATVPIRITALPEGRLQPAVETAAYVVVAEVVRYSSGSMVTVGATRRDGQLVVEITRDGDAPQDLIDLQDRVGALDGRLTEAGFDVVGKAATPDELRRRVELTRPTWRSSTSRCHPPRLATSTSFPARSACTGSSTAASSIVRIDEPKERNRRSTWKPSRLRHQHVQTTPSRTARREARLECLQPIRHRPLAMPVSLQDSGRRQGVHQMVVDHRHEPGNRGHGRRSRTVSRAILTRSYSASIRAMSSSAPSRIPDLARASSWRLSSEKLVAPKVAPLDFSVCAARWTSSAWPCSSPRLAASTSRGASLKNVSMSAVRRLRSSPMVSMSRSSAGGWSTPAIAGCPCRSRSGGT